MFDAKSLLEALMKGANPAQQQQGNQGQAGGMGGLGDLLGQIMGGQRGQHATPGSQAGGQADGQADGMGGLGDLLGKLGGGNQAGGQAGAGGLSDILGKLGGGQQGGGGIADILGQLLGQATSGVKEGAGRVETATGIGSRGREAVTQATGLSPEQLLEKLKELIAQNQMGAAATAGGLGAVVLGTKTGRSAAMGAAKLGALALIGGLAYKAYENYSQGRPMLNTASGFAAEQAPSGSGFEPQAVTNETAILYIRAMIAAAAADGRIDAAEQQKITGSLSQAGFETEAQDFLAREIQNPATADQLAAACQSSEQAVQVFTAARLAIDLDSNEENEFMADLASKLGIDSNLAQHVDAAAKAQTA